MNAQRFVAPNSREAMAQARAALGEQAVILSTRSTPDGFEVVATTEEALSAIAAQAASPGLQAVASEPRAVRATRASLQQRAAAQLPPVSPDSSVAQDTETLAMSTLSFQEYVRERMLRKRKAALEGRLEAPAAAAAAQRPLRET
ncbi:MAG: flagellar biosynthesis protein FlhF, partial [Tepidimonas sp.]|nr:flagellar biosynthesis protein FlhF [Tepidimonas sp.]